MPAVLSSKLKSNFNSAMAIALGLACTLCFTTVFHTESRPAEKFSVLKGHSHDRAPANFNKTRAPIYTSLERIDDKSNPELIRLKGTVTGRRGFENLKVIWDLPAGVQAVSGSLEAFVTLAAGESQSFELLIATSTAENRQVYFHAQTIDQVKGRNFGATSQFNTTKEEIIAKELKENFLKAREQVRSGELRKIIF